MRTLLYIAAIFLLQSCTSYQYLTIESAAISSENELYIHETSDYRLEYRFNGRNLPINLTIENKTTQPIYIDWSKSAAIVDDYPLSYIPNNTFSGFTLSNTDYDWGRSTTTGVFSGSITNNPAISFIPPGAKMQKTTLRLFNAINSSEQHISVNLEANKEYTSNDSDLHFRNYLTIYMDDQMEKVEVVDHEFFVRRTKISETTPGMRGLNENETYRNVQQASTSKAVWVTFSFGLFMVLMIVL